MTSAKEFYVPPQGPPQGVGPNPEIYRVMGEANIFKLLEDFYQELAQSEIRGIFPIDTPEGWVAASKRSAAFFVSVLGGPPLFHQLYGPPMMRKRHMAFEIDEESRQIWVATFRKVLDRGPERYSFPTEHLPGFYEFLESFSGWMVNRK